MVVVKSTNFLVTKNHNFKELIMSLINLTNHDLFKQSVLFTSLGILNCSYKCNIFSFLFKHFRYLTRQDKFISLMSKTVFQSNELLNI